jgi:hypothetical protein
VTCGWVGIYRRFSRELVNTHRRKVGGYNVTQVLLVGLQPEVVDYSDPALPQGMDAKKIWPGIDLALNQMTNRGWQADVCLIRPGATAGPTVEQRLATTTYDCVVIGAGVRLPPKSLLLFETIVNAVHRAAPNASIGFNTVPEDSADAAARWLPATERA